MLSSRDDELYRSGKKWQCQHCNRWFMARPKVAISQPCSPGLSTLHGTLLYILVWCSMHHNLIVTGMV